jgi:hypothetical protein
MQMVVTIGVAGWLGHKADLYFNIKFLAFGGIMYKLYQSITKE